MEALAREWKWTLKPTIAPLASASTSISLDVQGVDGEDIAVGFALRRRRAAVACLTKIGAGLNGLFRQLRLTGTGPLRQGRGYRPAG